jgi:hypothetical protein
MNRSKFFQTVTVEGVQELDFLWNSLGKFTLSYEPSYYRTNSDDVARPDLISYKVYKTVKYWWLICIVNSINNPLIDIEEGMILKIPSIHDILNFYQNYALR